MYQKTLSDLYLGHTHQLRGPENSATWRLVAAGAFLLMKIQPRSSVNSSPSMVLMGSSGSGIWHSWPLLHQSIFSVLSSECRLVLADCDFWPPWCDLMGWTWVSNARFSSLPSVQHLGASVAGWDVQAVGSRTQLWRIKLRNHQWTLLSTLTLGAECGKGRW